MRKLLLGLLARISSLTAFWKVQTDQMRSRIHRMSALKTINNRISVATNLSVSQSARSRLQSSVGCLVNACRNTLVPAMEA